MKNPRIYTSQPLAAGTSLLLDEGPSKHVAKVLRMPLNATLHLFNGDGYDYAAQIQRIQKKHVELSLLSKEAIEHESPLNTHIGLVMSRGDRMDYAIQKATELGVSRITPLTSERCEVKLNAERAEKRIAHWQQVAISACEQCVRARIPEICSIQSFSEFVANGIDIGSGELGLVLHHRESQSLTSYDRPARVRVLIGPEGGLSEMEIAQAQNAGYVACTLGPRVFRTETAPVASLAVLQWLWGDFNA